MASVSPVQVKETFFEDNPNFIEIKAPDTETIGNFENIDENVEEIWILQCKKGAKIKGLENQKIRFPGCVKINEKYQAEAVVSSNLKLATFGYANRKHYAIKSLPIAGEIVISEQIEDYDVKIPETTEADNVPMPECIKIRHPLLGSKFDKYLKIDKDIQKRLKGLDNSTNCLKTRIKTEKSQKKRKISAVENDEKFKLAKKMKIEKPDLLEVEEDLKWIKQI